MNIVATSELILFLLTAFIGVFVAMFIYLFFKQNQRSERLERNFMELVIHSKFNSKRADMEESLINLGRDFQNDADDFSDVNHLPLRGQRLAEDNSNSFLKSIGLNKNIKVNERQIFVLTPFSDAETETFAVIRDTLLKAGFEVFRGDESKRTDVFSHIIQSMLKSRVIIANINGRNPNVMYELGIAHMMDKPVILIAEMQDNLDSIPFDLRTKNILLYKEIQELGQKLPTAVLQMIS